MNEEPKNLWMSPLKGRRKLLAWLALFVVLVVLAAVVNVVLFDFKLKPLELLIVSSIMVGGGLLLAWLGIGLVHCFCSWRNLRWLLVGVAGVATLIALAYLEENVRGKHAWETHKRALEAEGEKLTIPQLAPPSVPDDQNLALTPLLKPLLDFSHGPNGIVWHDTNGTARLQGISAELEQYPKTNSLALGSLEKGTFADLAECQAYYDGHNSYPQPAEPGTPAADILVALGKFDPELKELREAAATRSYARFPVEYDYQPAWEILLPHLAAVKRLCQVTHVRAVALLELRQSQAAFDELQLGLRLSDSIRQEPILISHLVRIATLSINLQTLREGLIRHAWSEAQLAEIEKYLASVDLLAEYKLAMRGERALSTSSLNWLRRQGFWGHVMMYENYGDGVGVSGSDRGFNPYPSGWFYQNMLTISDMFQELCFPVVEESAHRVFVTVAAKSDATMESRLARPRPYNIYARVLMPAMAKAIIKSARAQSFVDAARVACALERYRLANGKLPETLDALSPSFIKAIPNDVIDGKPLRYRLKPDGGYVVYSVGWNQADDGGEIGWKKSTGDKVSNVDITQGDWVWQMPAKPITAAELKEQR